MRVLPYLMQNKDLTAAADSFPFASAEKDGDRCFLSHYWAFNQPETAWPWNCITRSDPGTSRTAIGVSLLWLTLKLISNHIRVLWFLCLSAAGNFSGPVVKWENFSTPNRDLRLLIAMDAVLGFSDMVACHRRILISPGLASTEQAKKKLQLILYQKISGLSINIPVQMASSKTDCRWILNAGCFEMAYKS